MLDMRTMLRILAVALALCATPALAQVPHFPQTLPKDTVVGRLGSGPGPSQAIPFSILQSRLSPLVDVTTFGAICSGDVDDADANAAAFTQALATGKNVFVPYCAAGYNIGTHAISLSSGQSVTCENQATVIYGQGSKVFYISSLGPQTQIENCTVQMAGASSGSTAFRLATTSAAVNVVKLINIKCLYAYECVGDEGTHDVAFLEIDDAYATQTYGRQFHIANSNGFIRLKDLSCDFTNEVDIGLVTWGCGEFDNFSGLKIEGLSAATGTGVGTPAFVASAPAWKFSSGSALWIDTLFADTTAGDGILIDNVDYIWGQTVESSLNLGAGITISNGSKGNITNLICIGGEGQTGAGSSKAGCDIDDQSLLNITNVYAETATGTGVRVRGASSQINIANLISTGNTGGGLSIEDTSNIINVTNGDVGGNTGTAYSNTSTGANIFVNFVSGGSQWGTQSAPGSPASGNGAFWFDSTDLRFHDKNASGTIGTTAVAKSSTSHQFFTAMSAAGVFSAGQPACADISDAGTACTVDTGTSGATLPLLNGNNTYSGTAIFTAAFPTLTANGQAGIGAGASSGAILGGEGSATDVTVVNKTGQTAASIPTGTQNVNFSATINLNPRTFASLTACGASNKGSLAAVTDSTVNTWGTTVVGSGANVVLAFCDGTNWTVAAK